MDLDPEALRKRLDERVRRGRARTEAAGEVRWLLEIEHRMGMQSKTSSDAAVKVIDEWLPSRTTQPGCWLTCTRDSSTRGSASSDSTPPPWDQIDIAWEAWRAQGRR
jgi:hypothetical protein